MEALDCDCCDAPFKVPLSFEGHTAIVNAVAVLDAGRLASGSSDNTVKIWDAAAKRCVATLTGHSGFVVTLTLLDAGRLASGSADKTIKVWSVHESGKGIKRRRQS